MGLAAYHLTFLEERQSNSKLNFSRFTTNAAFFETVLFTAVLDPFTFLSLFGGSPRMIQLIQYSSDTHNCIVLFPSPHVDLHMNTLLAWFLTNHLQRG